MKKFFLLSLFVSLAFTAINAQDVQPQDQPTDGPKISFNEQEHNYALLYKDAQGLQILYNDAAGNTIGMTCGRTGYTDLYGQRNPTELDFSGWGDGTQDGGFSETLDGEIVNAFAVGFDAQGRPVLFTDGAGHETAVVWE